MVKSGVAKYALVTAIKGGESRRGRKRLLAGVMTTTHVEVTGGEDTSPGHLQSQLELSILVVACIPNPIGGQLELFSQDATSLWHTS